MNNESGFLTPAEQKATKVAIAQHQKQFDDSRKRSAREIALSTAQYIRHKESTVKEVLSDADTIYKWLMAKL